MSDLISRQAVLDINESHHGQMPNHVNHQMWQEIKELPSVNSQEPKTEHYEKHIDHTDCIWYGSDSGCPVTCSQYRDGWNDAMDYIFKNGDGYRPYRRNENG